jgi:hypothetical protein
LHAGGIAEQWSGHRELEGGSESEEFSLYTEETPPNCGREAVLQSRLRANNRNCDLSVRDSRDKNTENDSGWFGESYGNDSRRSAAFNSRPLLVHLSLPFLQSGQYGRVSAIKA